MASAKDLHTLIRLRKWDVEEKQRALAALLRREESILMGIQNLILEKEQEAAFVGQAADVSETFTFSAYLKRWDERKELFDNALIEVRGHIDDARDELAEAYRDLKTFEVTQEQREAAEEKEAQRVETIELDEIGLNLHRRRAAGL